MGNLVKNIYIKVTWDTQAETFTTKKKFEVSGLTLPHFFYSREVTSIFHFFDNPSGTIYDLIL